MFSRSYRVIQFYNSVTVRKEISLTTLWNSPQSPNFPKAQSFVLERWNKFEFSKRPKEQENF